MSAHQALEAAKEQFNDQYKSTHNSLLSSMNKRGSPGADLAAAKERFNAAHSGSLSKRSPNSPGADLAAAEERFNAEHGGVLSQRDIADSAASRLEAAKVDFTNHHTLTVRQDDSAPTGGVADMPTSTMQKTVVPLVIGIVLILLFGIVAGIIVYKRRQKNKAAENAQHRRKHLDIEDDGADEDYEMGAGPRVQTVGGNGGFGISANRAGGWAENGEGGDVAGGRPAAAPRQRSSSLRKEGGVGGSVRGVDDKEFA